MHIILLILKVIGIVILVLLAVLVLLLLLILFAPIRYRVQADKRDVLFAKGRITFLFPMIWVQFLYQETFAYQVRLFGFCLFPHRKKEKRKRPEKEKPRKKEKHAGGEPEITIMERPLIKDQEVPKPKPGEQTTSKQKNSKQESSEQKKSKQKIGFWERMKKRIESWKNKVRGFGQKMQGLRDKKNQILEFLHNGNNQAAFRTIYASLRKLLWHIKPKKIVGELRFGFDDPCTTGQVLGLCGLLFPIYGQTVHIIPDFEAECFEGEVFVKGRMRLFTLLLICIKLLVNKEVKQLKINFEQLKEEL